MTNSKAIQSIFTNLRPFTVGFDDMFDHFDMLSTQIPHMTATNYPPSVSYTHLTLPTSDLV